MSTIMDQKKLEQAIKWIDEQLQDGKEIKTLLNEVGMRYNLGPKDMEFLRRFFSEKKNLDFKD